MLGGGKCQIRKPELSQTPQTLHNGRIDQAGFGLREFDEVVDGIVDPFHALERRIRGRGAATPTQSRARLRLRAWHSGEAVRDGEEAVNVHEVRPRRNS
jgi:hypothetical protein